MKRLIAAAFLAAGLAACAQYALLEPKRTTIGDLFSIEPQIAWNRYSVGHNEIWTSDGPLLQELRFITDVEEGETLYATQALEPPENWPKMKGQKRPSEFMELFVDALAATKANAVRTDNLQPAQFGPFPGFRFEFSFNREGLDYNGIAAGAYADGKLNMIVYIGSRLHYFDKHRDTFERILASIQKA